MFHEKVGLVNINADNLLWKKSGTKVLGTKIPGDKNFWGQNIQDQSSGTKIPDDEMSFNQVTRLDSILVSFRIKPFTATTFTCISRPVKWSTGQSMSPTVF